MENNDACQLNDAQTAILSKLTGIPKPEYKLIQAQIEVELEPLSPPCIEETEKERATEKDRETEEYRATCSEQFMEPPNPEEILVVDVVEGEVLIDGRDQKRGESEVADIINSKGPEDEMTEEGASIPRKKNIPKKRRRRKKDTEEDAPYGERYHAAKSKANRKKRENSSHPNILSKEIKNSENNLYACELCQRKFSHKFFLDRHFLTHTGEKPYACNVCEQRFNQKQNLYRHLLTHTGQKPFSCRVCKAEFNQRANLNRHLLTHTGEQPFKCSVCSLTFNQKANLNRHMLAHTGEKPFKCHKCDARFNQKANLNKHYKRHLEKPDKPEIVFGRKMNSETPFYLVYVGDD